MLIINLKVLFLPQINNVQLCINAKFATGMANSTN